MIQASTLHLVVALIGALALVTLALAVFLPQAARGRHCSESRTENEPKLSSLAFQSVADLVSVLGQAGAQQILDNTNTKLWFRATDHATAKTFADIAGQGPLLTRRESAAYRPVLQGRAVRNRLAFDATFAQQSTEVVGNLVREDWLMKLPRGQAFLYASGQTYKTRFPLMPEPKNRFPLEAAA